MGVKQGDRFADEDVARVMLNPWGRRLLRPMPLSLPLLFSDDKEIQGQKQKFLRVDAKVPTL
jgi:hypothetical protein